MIYWQVRTFGSSPLVTWIALYFPILGSATVISGYVYSVGRKNVHVLEGAKFAVLGDLQEGNTVVICTVPRISDISIDGICLQENRYTVLQDVCVHRVKSSSTVNSGYRASR